MAITKKTTMTGDIFSGISAVYAVADGFTGSAEEGGYDFSSATEFPVSDESGFNFDTGAPSVDHFKVKGLATDWVNTFTPGDGEITLEIPCNNTGIMEMVFGQSGTNTSVKIDTGTYTGKGYHAAQKAVYLGLVVLSDTEDKLLFIKRAKLMAQVIFDGSNKPLCVVLTGALASADNDSIAICQAPA